VRHHRSVTGIGRHLHRFQCFGQRADLVHFYENRIGGAALNPTREAGGVSHEKVVAHQLQLFADRVGEQFPALPIVFGHTVFNREDRGVLPHPVGPELHHLFGRPLALIGLFENVFAILEELARCRVQTDADFGSRLVAGLADRFQNRFDGFFVGLQHGSESALVADSRRVPLFAQHLFQSVKHLHTHAERFRKTIGAKGRDHELLKVHRIVGMRAAIDDIHHGNR